MTICAYCGGDGPFTKEHIYPKCLYDLTPEQDITFFEIGEEKKAFTGQATVRDVCKSCNNGFLAKLDSYFCGLYESSFYKFIGEGEQTAFEYDFDKLARWLLKVEYNSARTYKIDIHSMKLLIPYIRYGYPRPSGLAIFIQLVIPFDSDKYQSTRNTPGVTPYKLPPMNTRCGPINFIEHEDWYGLARFFAINSYYFYILHPYREEQLKKQWKKALQFFREGIPSAQWLQHNKHAIVLNASSVDALAATKSEILRFREPYEEFKKKKKKGKYD